MELSSLVKISVSTLDANQCHVVTVKVSNNNDVQVDDIFQRITADIGLQSSSCPYFSLFRGRNRPIRRCRPGETVAADTKDLTIQRWCFDAKVETSKLLSDAVATHLLFLQATEGISSGRLRPSSDDLHQLEEFLDPSFVLENRYVATCQTLPRYWSQRFTDCVLLQDFSTESLHLPKNIKVTLYVGRDGVEIETGETSYLTPWRHLKCWSRDADTASTVSFDLLTSVFKLTTLHIATDQAELMLAVVMEIVKVLQSEDDSAPAFLTSMIKTKEDVMTHWNNVLYNPDTE